MLMNSPEQSPFKVSYLGGYIRKDAAKRPIALICRQILYSRLFLKRISEKLVDLESKVVRDRQDDNVLRDYLHCLQGYLTLFPVKYTHLILSYTQRCLLKVKRNRFLLLFQKK